MSKVSPEWLALREPADAVARSLDLVAPLKDRFADRDRVVVHDLGSGTGSMARWLAPLLPVPSHWVLYDRDTELLDLARVDGATVETRVADITRLTPGDLAGADLVTASALLDMFTADEVERVVAACAGTGAPALFTLSVVGRVELTPAEPLDAEVTAAFNAHQRRTTGGRTLLGPDAVGAAVDAFGRHGIGVHTAQSPWRLGPEHAALAAEWFTGWLDPACEQRPELVGRVGGYARDRLAAAVAGGLAVVVHHTDVLTEP